MKAVLHTLCGCTKEVVLPHFIPIHQVCIRSALSYMPHFWEERRAGVYAQMPVSRPAQIREFAFTHRCPSGTAHYLEREP